MWKKRAWLTFLVASTLVVGQTAVAVDNNGDLVDDALTVSVAAAGDQSFPETDLPTTPTAAVIDFNNLGNPCSTANLTNGSQIQAISISSGASRNIGSGSGSLACGAAGVYGGAFATGFYVAPPGESVWTLTFTETQRYVGFWWSAGNSPNSVQLLDASGNTLLSPAFDANSLYQTIFGQSTVRCIVENGVNDIVNDYCGNPNSVYNTTYNPPYVNNVSRAVVGEPYAFIHMRFPGGFRAIRFSGRGFEFDNVTISETVPELGAEEEVVGALPAYSLTAARVIPVDPRSQSVPFPGVLLAGAASTQPNATLCLTQVSNSSGAQVYSGSSGIQVSVPATMGITQSLSPPRFTFTGSQTTVRSLSNQIRIISSTTSRTVASSETVWLRASVQAALNTGDLSCSVSNNVITAFVIELRPIRLNSVNQLGIPID
jgi:hypothetical protein